MGKRIEFDCTCTADRIAVNAFLAHMVRDLRSRPFKLVSQTNSDGTFDIRITSGDTESEAATEEATPVVASPVTKRSRKAATAADMSDSTTTECCLPG